MLVSPASPRCENQTSAAAWKPSSRWANDQEFSPLSWVRSISTEGGARSVNTRSSVRYSRALTSNTSRKSKSNSSRRARSTRSSVWFSMCRRVCMLPAPTNMLRVSEIAPAGRSAASTFCMKTAAE